MWLASGTLVVGIREIRHQAWRIRYEAWRRQTSANKADPVLYQFNEGRGVARRGRKANEPHRSLRRNAKGVGSSGCRKNVWRPIFLRNDSQAIDLRCDKC